MSIKSGLFAAITAVVLTLALGNRAVIDNLPDGGPAPQTLRVVTNVFTWDPDRINDDLRTGQYVGLVALVGAAFVLGGLAGRARPAAAFIGGWGAAVGAAAIHSMLFAAIAGDAVFFGGPGNEVGDRVFFSAGRGAQAMIVVGWLVGIAVLLGSFGKHQPKVAGAAPSPPGGWSPPPGPSPHPQQDPYPQQDPSPQPGYPPSEPAAPSATPPPAAPPPGAPAPGGPQIGLPPDRTQIFGEPPR